MASSGRFNVSGGERGLWKKRGLETERASLEVSSNNFLVYSSVLDVWFFPPSDG